MALLRLSVSRDSRSGMHASPDLELVSICSLSNDEHSQQEECSRWHFAFLWRQILPLHAESKDPTGDSPMQVADRMQGPILHTVATSPPCAPLRVAIELLYEWSSGRLSAANRESNQHSMCYRGGRCRWAPALLSSRHHMETKTAFARWENRIAPVFDVAIQMHVVVSDAGRVISEKDEPLANDAFAQKAAGLAHLGVSTLVCGAISRPLQDVLTAHGIEVIPFVTGDLAEVIGAWLKGDLHGDAFCMPGCCGRHAGPRLHGRAGTPMDTGSGRHRRRCGGAMQGGHTDTPMPLPCQCPSCGCNVPHHEGERRPGQPCPNCGASTQHKLRKMKG